MKAIETSYNGYKFRSRLEARWAVYFDSLEFEYWYEPEGYDLNGTWYLPDFYLPRVKMFVEVKGRELNTEETLKAQLLARHTKKSVLLLVGPPDAKCYDAWKHFEKGHFENQNENEYFLSDYALTHYHNYYKSEKRFYASSGGGDVSFLFGNREAAAINASRRARF